jgi:fused signal recognition particle receptor
MARDWDDVFIVDRAAVGSAPDEAAEPEEQRVGRFRRLRESLRRTRQALAEEIQATLFEDLSDETWERLEEALIYADVGATTTANVVGELEREAMSGSISGGDALSNRLTELLAGIAQVGDGRIDLRPEPTVILVAGVNGTGKTTSSSSSCGRPGPARRSSAGPTAATQARSRSRRSQRRAATATTS